MKSLIKKEVIDFSCGVLLFGICNLINADRQKHECIYIDDLIWKYYPWQYKKCHRNVCCGECGKRVGE